jgi:CheY-like chemotaxis protein
MAFLLVQHRDPGHPSLLAEILSKDSSIPVVDDQDGIELEGDGDPLGARGQSVPKEPTQMSGGKPMHVLIVDDNEDTTETAALLFGAWDHEIRVAQTGPEALQIASDFEPEVILMDIGLPEMEGYEVARRLRQAPRFKDTLMIAVSGYGRNTDQQLSREAGFDEHLIKPVNLERLNRLLSEKVGLKRGTK